MPRHRAPEGSRLGRLFLAPGAALLEVVTAGADVRMNNRLLVSVVAAVCLVTGTIWGTTRGADAASPQTGVITADRGVVAVTVGGIGQVTTLTDAARLAAPVADSSATSAGSTPSPGPADIVFPAVTGHVTSLLVGVGDVVEAGQPIARLADDGTARTALVQARSDLATARLELAQKQVHDPLRGLPPTAEEIAHARQSLTTARDQLARLLGAPLPSDLSAARLEIDRANTELETEQAAAASRPEAVEAAQLAVAAATQRLATLTGSPDQADVTAARLEVAKAQLEQEALTRRPAGPTAAQVAAADAAVAAAQEKLTVAQTGGIAADIATAQADLARARADREALDQVGTPPSAAAQAAAQLAVDAAQRKLDQLLRPPAALVEAARGELAKARADLAALRSDASDARLAAARSAVTAAEDRLGLVLQPAPEAVSLARAEVTRAAADLAILRQRGAPASATDLAIARLRVRVGEQQVQLAQELMKRQVVRAPATGTVTSVLTAKGAAVDGATPMMRVQDLDNLVVSVNLTEFDVSRTRVGAPTQIKADALGGRRYTGDVVDVALSGSKSGGVVTFPVIVSIDDTDELRPGMSVSVRVVVQQRDDVVRVPVDAIADREGREATISVRNRAGEVAERTVTLGLIGARYAEVRSGLRAGEKVVVETDEEA
jgi:HlyD family secretion protein